MDLIHNAQSRFSYYPAIISGQQIISYRQLDRLIEGARKKIKTIAIKPKSPVAISSPLSASYIIVLLALWREKGITCSLNPQFPYKTVTQHLARIGCRRLLRSTDIESLVSHESPQIKIAKTGIALNQKLTITFTSGSSGIPKAALHSYANHYYSALGSNQNIPIAPGDRWLLSLPLYHVSGLGILFRTFLAGGTVVIPSDKDILANIRKFRITQLSLVPTQLYKILSDKGSSKTLTSIKSVLLGGAPIPTNLIQQSLKRSLPIHISYGLTEMASQVATSTRVDRTRKNISTAKILNYRRVKIANNHEILVKGKALFVGYVLKGKNLKAVDQGGWFHTGDLGMKQGDRITVWGREDNMFISGGENIFPEEIEKKLLDIKGIEKAVVIPVADKIFGQRPIAFVKTNLSSVCIRQLLAKNLPKFKIPDKFLPWPKSIAERMKIDRMIFKRILKRML